VSDGIFLNCTKIGYRAPSIKGKMNSVRPGRAKFRDPSPAFPELPHRRVRVEPTAYPAGYLTAEVIENLRTELVRIGHFEPFRVPHFR
jgi:hypothetical protein